jgi:hypothetical protein
LEYSIALQRKAGFFMNRLAALIADCRTGGGARSA